MSYKWERIATGDLFDLINGFAFKSGDFAKSGAPVLKIKNIKAGRLRLDSLSYVSTSFLTARAEKVTKKNDLLISMTGNRHDGSMDTWVGKVCYFGVSEEYLINQRVGILRAKPDANINSRFFSYQLASKSFQKYFISVATSSGGQANLSPDQIKSTELIAPPKPVQDRIVRIVGSLEDKVKVNQRINETLEQIAQALFKSWFVDFEPVKAKMAALEVGGTAEEAESAAMQAISGKSEAELDTLRTQDSNQYDNLARTAALFPSAMDESEIGDIPEGWQVNPLSEMTHLIGGGTPKKSNPEYWGGDVPWFSVKDAPSESNVFVLDTEDQITDLGLQKSSAKVLPIGTTIISARGTVGKLALTGRDMAMNQSCYGVRGVAPIGPYLNYLNLHRAVDKLKRNVHGAVFDTITRDTFKTVSLVQAPELVMSEFESLVTPLFEKIKANVLEVQTLGATRDTLLPKLLSGELAIPEAEEQSPEPADV